MLVLRLGPAVAVALLLVTAACSGETTSDQPDADARPVQGGTVVIGAEQEPTEGLNGELACCNLFWNTFIIENPILAGAYEPQPDFTYLPVLLDGEPEITDDPFTITYSIKEEAAWNDGTPISAEDFEFTWQTFVDPRWDLASRAGYDQIQSAEIIDDKTIEFTFERPYAGYKELFTPVLPKHALEGENFNDVWLTEILNPKTGEPISSGPFQFESYEKGNQLTLVRNDDYWGERKAYLDRIVFRFIPETTSEIQAMRAGEVDAIYPQPQLELSQLQDLPDVRITTAPSTAWEHVDFQFEDPLLGQDFVREAIAYGIDRQAVLDILFKDIAPETEILDNLIWVSNSEFYEPHFDQYRYDPEQARSLLEDNGCTEGDDGIYECDGRRLSFTFGTTTDNRLRELAFEVMQEGLRQAGIEVTAEFKDAALFVADLEKDTWDMVMYAYFSTPEPSNSVPILSCNGEQNDQSYCNEEATALLEESNVLPEPQQRADILNQADELISEDIPVLPLYQKPTFFAFDTGLHNAQDNPAGPGFTWNTEEWWIEGGQQ